jgi:protein-S-isoprenylcysteine O-methyltransferase Ste14
VKAGLAVLVLLAWGAVFVFRVEPLWRAFPAYGRAERFWVLFTPLALSLHFGLFGVSVTLADDVEPWRGLAGAAVLGLGIAVWFWGRAGIGPARLRRLPDDPPLVFRRDGAFGLVRNPLALGVLVAAAAPLVVRPCAAFVATFAAGAVGLIVRTGQEERRMHAQIGPAFDAYCREVKRLIPFVW